MVGIFFGRVCLFAGVTEREVLVSLHHDIIPPRPHSLSPSKARNGALSPWITVSFLNILALNSRIDVRN